MEGPGKNCQRVHHRDRQQAGRQADSQTETVFKKIYILDTKIFMLIKNCELILYTSENMIYEASMYNIYGPII